MVTRGVLNKFDDYRKVLTKIPSKFQKSHDLAILKFEYDIKTKSKN